MFIGLGISRQHLIQLIGLALLLLLTLAACRSQTDPTPSASLTAAAIPAATAVPTTTPAPSATSIPDLGLINTVDAEGLDIVRDADLNASGHYDEIRVAEDGTRHLIPLNAVEWGGVARDGIPALDSPSYVGPDRWSQMVYDPDGLVIGVEVNGKYRAYPLQILIWHEIVNETFDGKHLLVTY